jgi:GNAT superfamily N-acetyltransferase
MESHIRKLTAEDEPFLWTALYYALHVPPGADPLPTEVVRQPDLARYVSGWMERPGDLGLVAEVDGEPVGAAWLRRWPSGARGYGFVDEATPELSMSLLPGYRGRGIGTVLLHRLLTEAAQEADAVSLSVSESNPARRLYERFGFVVVGESEGGAAKMLKRLSAQDAV